MLAFRHTGLPASFCSHILPSVCPSSSARAGNSLCSEAVLGHGVGTCRFHRFPCVYAQAASAGERQWGVLGSWLDTRNLCHPRLVLRPTPRHTSYPRGPSLRGCRLGVRHSHPLSGRLQMSFSFEASGRGWRTGRAGPLPSARVAEQGLQKTNLDLSFLFRPRHPAPPSCLFPAGQDLFVKMRGRPGSVSPGFAGLRVTSPLAFRCESGDSVLYLWTFLTHYPSLFLRGREIRFFKGVLL